MKTGGWVVTCRRYVEVPDPEELGFGEKPPISEEVRAALLAVVETEEAKRTHTKGER